jgi:hypothetical protein
MNNSSVETNSVESVKPGDSVRFYLELRQVIERGFSGLAPTVRIDRIERDHDGTFTIYIENA